MASNPPFEPRDSGLTAAAVDPGPLDRHPGGAREDFALTSWLTMAVLSACGGDPTPRTTIAPTPEAAAAAAAEVRLDARGDPLPAGAVQRLGTARLRHRDEVASLAWLDGGAVLVSAGADGEIRAWDGGSGRRLVRLGGARGTSVASNPGGDRLVVANPGVAVLDALEDAVLWRVEAPIRVASPAFSPDGRHLAWGDGSTLAVVRADDGSPVQTFVDHRDRIDRVAWSPDGRWLASVDGRGVGLVRDAATGALTASFTLTDGSLPCEVLAFSPDGGRLAAGRDPIEVRDAATGEYLREITGHGPAEEAAFGPDGLVVVSGSTLPAVTVWGRDGGTRRSGWYDADSASLVEAALAPDADRVALADAIGRVRIRRVSDGAAVDDRAGHDREVVAVAFAGPETLWTAGGGGRVLRWDVRAGTSTEMSERHAGGATSLAVSPDGRHVISAGWDGVARVWDAAGTTPTARYRTGAPGWGGYAADGVPLTFASDRGLLAWRSPDAPASLAPPRTGVVAVDPQGRRAAVPTQAGTSVIDLDDGTLVRSLTALDTPPSNLQAAAFAPDGATIAFAGADSRTWLVPVDRGDSPRILVGPPGLVSDVAWSPDGRRVVTTHPDGAWVWDAATGEPLARLSGHDDFATATAWSPDGRAIATASADGTVLLWSAP